MSSTGIETVEAVTPADPRLEPPRAARHAPGVVLAVGLAVTGALVFLTVRDVRQGRERAFERAARDARTAIERRVAFYGETLFGLRSLFAVDRPVTRVEFNRYVELVGAQSRAPGALAITFNRRVSRAGLAQYENGVRRDGSLNGVGYPGFRVHPDTDAAELFVVEYVEPMSGNEAALGFDVGSESVRRQAVHEARDNGEPVATAPIELVQGGRGFLLFLAVYDRASIPVTAPARRRAFGGVVVAAFRVQDVMGGVLGADPSVEVEIYDVGRIVEPTTEAPSERNRLFDGDGRRDALDPDRAPSPNRFLDLNVADRRWRIFAMARPALGAERFLPWATGGAGVALTLLLAALLSSFARSRKLAVALATDMTAHLRQRERDLELANVQLEETNRRLQRANEELQEMAARLTEADRERIAFLGTISHELRTPLAAITGFTELLLRDASRLDDQTRDRIARVARNAGALTGLIDELLDFARLERDAFPIEPTDFSLSDLARTTVEQLSTVLSVHRTRLELHPPVRAHADPMAVGRILTNLLTNAVKFAPADTEVTVAVRGGDRAELSVTDRGPGIPEKERARVFEPFYRGSQVPIGVPGTGVGLAVVRALASKLGGTVSVEEPRGGGTCFRVTLPLGGA